MAGDAAAEAAGGEVAGAFDPVSGMLTPAIHVNSVALARQIARESDALFPATATMLASDIAPGTLVELPFHVPAMRTDYCVVTLVDRSVSPAAEAFLNQLRDVERELSEAAAA